MKGEKALLLTSVYACMATLLVVAVYTSLRLFKDSDVRFVIILGVLFASSVIFYALMKVVGHKIAETVYIYPVYPQLPQRHTSTLDEWNKLEAAIADISDSDS